MTTLPLRDGWIARNGVYSFIAGFPPLEGTYFVGFNRDSGYSLSTGVYYKAGSPQGTVKFAQASPLTLTEGQSATGIDFKASQCGVVTGSFTGLPVNNNARAVVFNDSDPDLVTRSTNFLVSASGAYSVTGLAPGSYDVALYYDGEEYFAGGANTAAEATNIVIPDTCGTVPGPALSGVKRQAGADRFATSAAISQATYTPGVPVAYIANGLTFPDALAGAAAAGHLGGPVLLTRTDSISAEISAELTRLKPTRIVVLGGTGAISDTVLNQLKSYATTITRQAGADRFATSAAISKATYSPGVPVAYIANGLTFPDALAGAAAAGHLGGPVLLTRTDSISADVATDLKRLKPTRIVVLGGTGAISDTVLNQLKSYATTVTRQAGADRFATSAAISQATYTKTNPNLNGVETLYIANGLDFPDALAGAAAAGHLDGPVLLTRTNTASPEVIAEIKRILPRRIIILGGTGAISDTLATQLSNLAENSPYAP
ncbi:cell wall-binding repeat-containing protein [Xylanimonas ulmi]|nr:cell wall-binding repeat-containing protein [Xylanibacterium ulmi]